MGDPVFLHRLQFAFTIIYHYLFPVLTMGLALLIVVMKALGLRRGGERWNDAARFWIRIFGINFAVGVVTGIPMEFQFGTNWAHFSRYAGNVVGHTLAMEGLFAFFLESSFLSLLVFGERAPGAASGTSWPRSPSSSGAGSPATSSSRPTPSCSTPSVTRSAADGTLRLADFSAFVLNPWAIAQYAHNMISTVVTASFVVAALGAFYVLQGKHLVSARLFLKLGIDRGARLQRARGLPHRRHPGQARGAPPARRPRGHGGALRERAHAARSTLSASRTCASASSTTRSRFPGSLSVPRLRALLHRRVGASSEFPERDWPDNIELLYYAFHIMAGLGTILIAIMAVATLLAWLGRLEKSCVDAVGPDALLPIPLHRDDGGLDDGGAGAPALAGLRAAADGGGREPHRARGARCSSP